MDLGVACLLQVHLGSQKKNHLSGRESFLSIISSPTKDLILQIINMIKVRKKLGLQRRASERTYIIFLSIETEY